MLFKYGLKKNKTLTLCLFISLLGFLCLTACSATKEEQPSRSDQSDEKEQVSLLNSPVDFVLYLIEKFNKGEWNTIKDYLALDLQDFEEEAVGWILPLHLNQKEDWVTEEHEKWVTVRVKENPCLSLILKKDPKTGWRMDPGPMARRLLKLKKEQPNSELTKFNRTVDISSDSLLKLRKFLKGNELQIFKIITSVQHQNKFLVDNLILQSALSTETGSDGVLFNIHYVLLNPEIDLYIPTDNLTWSGAGQSGTASVVWTDAYPSLNRFLLPGSLPAYEEYEGVKVSYTVSFKLHGAEKLDVVTLKVPLIINNISTIHKYEFQIMDTLFK